MPGRKEDATMAFPGLLQIMRPIVLWVSLAGVVCISGCAEPSAVSFRDKMRQEAKANYRFFPDGENVKLTHFAYLGDVQTSEGMLRIVFLRAVLTGMMSPRGQRAILVFDETGTYVRSLGCDASSYPLWCEGSKIYLAGRTLVSGVEGNAWDLTDGVEGAKLIWSPEYGSWQPE